MSMEVIRSEKLFQGRVFSVRREEVRLDEDRVTDYDIIEHPASVTLVPIDEEGAIWFVRQYRHAARDTLLELPAGTVHPGEDPHTCGIRECREEIGMSPGRLTLLWEGFLAPGYSTEYMYFYRAESLAPAPLKPDEDEILHVERVGLDQAQELVTSGSLRDVKTLTALYLALGHLGRDARASLT